jgi:hypothetical protein
VTYVDEHHVAADVPSERAWDVVRRLGGEPRLYAPRPLWRARGLLDGLIGGPGDRIEGPGRPLRVGDAMDFWEVVEVHPPSRLRLRALTRLPGTAHLEVGVRARGTGTELSLRTEFEAAGILGHAFWWAELPAHTLVFELMTHRLARLVTE